MIIAGIAGDSFRVVEFGESGQDASSFIMIVGLSCDCIRVAGEKDEGGIDAPGGFPETMGK